jgi:hypothetical protein
MIRLRVVDQVVLILCVLSGRSSALPGDVSSLSPRCRSDFRMNQLMARRVNTMFLPIMASRLMLSLKKATAQPTRPWSLKTMTSTSQGRSTGNETINSVPRVPRGSHEIPRSPAAQNGGDIELGAVPPNLDSHHGG